MKSRIFALLAAALLAPGLAANEFHPLFPLLDANGNTVLETGLAMDAMRSCGGCHDTGFIAQTSDHAAATAYYGPERYAAMNTWTPHPTKTGKPAWQNPSTGEIRYQREMPGGHNSQADTLPADGQHPTPTAMPGVSVKEPDPERGWLLSKGEVKDPAVVERMKG